jgi:IS5 family transposase
LPVQAWASRPWHRVTGNHDCDLHFRLAYTPEATDAVISANGHEKFTSASLAALGVRHVVIPRKGKPGKARQAAGRRPAFRRTVKWRTGSEGRISTLKRQYGWDRTRLDGIEGARTWAGYGVLARNLAKISALAS